MFEAWTGGVQQVYVDNIVIRTEVTCIGDDDYPKLLSMTERPPERLYFRGDIGVLQGMCISVVGSRKNTQYGRWAGTELGRALGENGITVVSGLAKGIDSFAHKGALSADGKTAAVMGCGIDICYPAANRDIWKEIIRKGVVVSEYRPGIQPARYTFPQRNRIISGLSYATVVVEACLESGSLITAECAADQGRDVYAVPGDICSVTSLGTNKLIRDGALPLTVIGDILSDYHIPVRKDAGDRRLEKLGDDEKAVLSILSEKGEMTVKEICSRLQVSRERISGIVAVLEIKGLVCSELGKIFVAKL